MPLMVSMVPMMSMMSRMPAPSSRILLLLRISLLRVRFNLIPQQPAQQPPTAARLRVSPMMMIPLQLLLNEVGSQRTSRSSDDLAHCSAVPELAAEEGTAYAASYGREEALLAIGAVGAGLAGVLLGLGRSDLLAWVGA